MSSGVETREATEIDKRLKEFLSEAITLHASDLHLAAKDRLAHGEAQPGGSSARCCWSRYA